MTTPRALADWEAAAEATLPSEAWDYYSRGGFDELMLVDNHTAWRRWQLVPQVLVDVSKRDHATTVIGRPRPHPVLMAPSARHGLATADAELATAGAASDSGSLLCVSIGATLEPGLIGRLTPDTAKWFQLCLFSDLDASRELAVMAAETGYEALVVTVDNPVVGVRRHAEVALDASLHASMVEGLPAHLRRPPHNRLGLNPGVTWAELAAFVRDVELPVLVKGVATGADAAQAAECGVAGIIVSNHGGRQLDRTRPTAEALPEVVEAVGTSVDVLVDGGIRGGIDVFVALALGARAVLIGRPVLWGLAVDGRKGAAEVVRTLVHELDIAMALTGVTSVDDVTAARIEPRRS